MWIFLLAASLFAQETVPGRPVSPEIQAKIEALIGALGTEKHEDREAASAQLRALCEANLESPALRGELRAAIRRSSDAEVDARLGEALRALPLFTVTISTEPGPGPDQPTIVFILRNVSDEEQVYAPIPRDADHFMLNNYSGLASLTLDGATERNPWTTHSHHGIAYINEDDPQQAMQRPGARRLKPGEAVEERLRLLPDPTRKRVAISFVGNDVIWPDSVIHVGIWWQGGYRTPGTQEPLRSGGRVRPSPEIILEFGPR